MTTAGTTHAEAARGKAREANTLLREEAPPTPPAAADSTRSSVAGCGPSGVTRLCDTFPSQISLDCRLYQPEMSQKGEHADPQGGRWWGVERLQQCCRIRGPLCPGHPS